LVFAPLDLLKIVASLQPFVNKVKHNNHEKDLPAIQKKEKKQAWVPRKNGYCQWSQGIGFPQKGRAQKADRV